MDPRDIEVVSNVDFKAERMHERLVKLRKERRLSVRTIAAYIGCSPSTIYRWESGETKPSYSEISSLARLYNVSLDWIINNIGEKEP